MWKRLFLHIPFIFCIKQRYKYPSILKPDTSQMIEVLLLPFFVLLTCFTAMMFLFILFVDKKLCYLCLSHWHGAIDNFLFVRVKVSHSDNLKIKYFVNNLRCMFVVNIFFYHCFQNLYYPSDLKMLLYGSTIFIIL